MQLLIILYILFITCSSSSSSKTQQTTATSLCNFKVLHNNNNHSDLNFTLISEPTIIRKYYSSAKYTPSKLSSSRLGQSLVGLAHPYYYIIGEGTYFSSTMKTKDEENTTAIKGDASAGLFHDMTLKIDQTVSSFTTSFSQNF